MIRIQKLFSNSFNNIMEHLSSLVRISKPEAEISSDENLLEESVNAEVENNDFLDESFNSYEFDTETLYEQQCIEINDINELSISCSAYETLLNADLTKISEIAGHSKYWLKQNIENMTDENLEDITRSLAELDIHLKDYTRDDVIEMSFKNYTENYREYKILQGESISYEDSLSVDIDEMNFNVYTRSCLKKEGLNKAGDIANKSKYYLIKNIEGINMKNICEIETELAKLNLDLVEMTEEDFLDLKRYRKLDELIENYLISADSLLEKQTSNYPVEILNKDIDSLDLTVRTFNCLKRAGINTVGDIVEHSKLSLSRIKNLAQRSFEEVINKLEELKVYLDDSNIIDYIEKTSKDSIKLDVIREIQNIRIRENCNEEYQVGQQLILEEWNDLKGDVINRIEEIKRHKKEVEDFRTKPPSLQKLDELIGLEGVKEQVKSIIAHTVINKEKNEIMKHNTPNPFNMVFLGNPGTGKTMVAKIIAEIYKDLGLMKSGHLVTATRADLVADYLSQTAGKTTEVFNRALDGILFIDEAYSLFYGGQCAEDYGIEVINTLTGLMTENIGRCCVILAGYPKEMKYLLKYSNPGFKDRFPFIIEFDDYDVESLERIFKLNLDKRSLELDISCHQILTEHLRQIYVNRDRNFSNGRMVVNYLQKVVMNQELRLYKLKLTGANLTAKDYFTLKSEDFDDVLDNFIEEKPTIEIVKPATIGFIPKSLTLEN